MLTAPRPAPTVDEILAPACKALFCGTPSELALAIQAHPRLRGSYPRAAAVGMWNARRSGDVAAATKAAAFAVEIAKGHLPGLVTA